MILQFGHSNEYDFKKELYDPIKQSDISEENEIIFPHDEENKVFVYSKESIKNIDIFFAEVSYPATGLGIELWFASAYWKKIICFSKKWAEISGSLKYICDDFFEYTDSYDMIGKIKKYLS